MSEAGLTTSDAEASAAEAKTGPGAAETYPPVVEVEQSPPGIQPELPPPQGGDHVQPAVGIWRRYRLFVVTVVLPMAIAASFLLFIAAPRYASSASFIVRSTEPEAAPDILAQTAKGQRSTIAFDETYAVVAYLTSRDVVDLLARNDNLRGMLSRPQADFVFRYPIFWLPDNNEFLYRRLQWMAKAEVDPVTSFCWLNVNAFTPEDAQAIAQAMLGYGEALLNRMNERFYQAEVAVADGYVAKAQKEVDAIEAELKAFRNASGSVDPNLVAQSKLSVIQGLTTQLAQINASIKQTLVTSHTSPTLTALWAQARSYRDEIQKRSLEIAGATGSEAVKLETYDQLSLGRALAAQSLSDAVAQREKARQDAFSQHLYIQVITRPNLPLDFARYPRTTVDLLALLAICLAVFQVLRMLRNFALEHAP